MNSAIASREEWLDARKALLAKEGAMTPETDAFHADSRQLSCVSEGPKGECALSNLFRGRSQLVIYHFSDKGFRPGVALSRRKPCAAGVYLSRR